MAVLTLTNAVNTNDVWLPDLFEFSRSDPNLSLIRSPTSVTLTNPASSVGVLVITVTGVGLTYAPGTPTRPLSGEVQAVTLSVNGQVWMTVTGLSIELTDFDHFMFGWERFGQQRTPNGWELFSLFLAGNDTINGSDLDDEIIGGRNGGNDVIYGGGGWDFIEAGAGNDTIFGGHGRDTYSLSESFFDGSAFRGAVVNLATGVATDSWGGTDTLFGIERVQGSRMSDNFTGSAAEEQFAGLRGNDTIDGGSGFDAVWYHLDADFGGLLGVTVNLATGTATDGWGNTDRLSGIEVVSGTAANDVFIGNADRNFFIGREGVDRIDGGAGRDVVFFGDDDVNTGAVVNLALSTNRVINDGFGNVENLIGIEDLAGTFLADRFTGNRLANELYGDAGNDTLSGGAGNDWLDGGSGRDRLSGGAGSDVFSFQNWDNDALLNDTVTDFVSGVDRLRFEVDSFAGMDSTLRFVNGTSAGGSGASWFFFNPANRQLFWDSDGVGGSAPVLVATLTGVTALTLTDFDLV